MRFLIKFSYFLFLTLIFSKSAWSLSEEASEKKKNEKNHNYVIDGRIMIDAAHIVDDKTTTLEDGLILRRLWVGTTGNVQDWNYRVLVGLSDDKTEIYDAVISYKGFKNSEIFVGNFFENGGIEARTQNLITSFMERSEAIMAFFKLRRSGISYNYYGDDWSAKIGVFGSEINDARIINKGKGFSWRTYVAPINDNQNYNYLHFGLNGNYRTPDSPSDSISFKSTGNNNVVEGVLVNSSKINDVDNYQQYGAEFRYQKGALTIVSEYIKTLVERQGSDLSFDGSYISASYFLGPANYKYDYKIGAPVDVIVNKSWELALRYSNIDLNDKDIQGGNLDSYDFGVNYYLDKHTKLMLNYIINNLDQNSSLNNKNPQYLMFRAQMSF